MVAPVPPEPSLPQAMLDKASDRQDLREHLRQPGRGPVIPPKSHRLVALDEPTNLDKVREKGERFCNNRKPCRRMATRYEPLSQTFLALMHLVAVWIIIK